GHDEVSRFRISDLRFQKGLLELGGGLVAGLDVGDAGAGHGADGFVGFGGFDGDETEEVPGGVEDFELHAGGDAVGGADGEGGVGLVVGEGADGLDGAVDGGG